MILCVHLSITAWKGLRILETLRLLTLQCYRFFLPWPLTAFVLVVFAKCSKLRQMAPQWWSEIESPSFLTIHIVCPLRHLIRIFIKQYFYLIDGSCHHLQNGFEFPRKLWCRHTSCEISYDVPMSSNGPHVLFWKSIFHEFYFAFD